MKCETALEHMVLASYGELPAEQAIVLERHVTDCESCRLEMAAIGTMMQALELRPVVEISPNFLAQSRVRLDEALDEIPAYGFLARLRINFFRWVNNVQSAPALATLLVGCGFLAGNYTYRYQVAHAPKPPVVVSITDPARGEISNVNGIMETADPEIVQVLYNRVVPESVEGSLNDPEIRKLLLMGTQAGAVSSVRRDAVGALVHECRAGHACPAETDGKGIRSALLTAMRSDKDAGVRMKALEGLQPYVGQDRKVRDALLVALLHDPSAQVRRTAVQLLEPVEADSSVRQVLQTVSANDDNPYVRTVSFQALRGADSIQ